MAAFSMEDLLSIPPLYEPKEVPVLEPPKVEISIESRESGLAAVKGGASSIQLCQNLSVGGLTPSIGLLHYVRSCSALLPINVVVRPRSGDYCFTQREFMAMVCDIENHTRYDIDGIVVGVLTENGEVDAPKCGRIMELAEWRATTFNRAFDLTPDPFEAMETLIRLGFKRILTSGCKPNCLEGAEMIRELIIRAKERITIVPSGGITEANLKQIVALTDPTEIHAYCNVPVSNVEQSPLEQCFGPVPKRCFAPTVDRMVRIAKKQWRILRELGEEELFNEYE